MIYPGRPETLAGPEIQGVEPLWTVAEVMQFLRRSRRWVYAHADELGAIREFGGLRFDPAALRARATGGATVIRFGPTNAR